MNVKVIVTLKNGVLDPQGKAIQQTLNGMTFKNVSEVRQGKFFDIEVNESDENKAKSMLIRAFTDEVVDGLTNKQLISFHQEIVENWFVSSNLVNKDD